MGIRREVEVALSRKTQPVWVRVAECAALGPLTLVAWRLDRLGVWLLTVGSAACVLHGVYRTATHGWTRSWGGWNYFAPGTEASEQRRQEPLTDGDQMGVGE